MLSFEAGGMRRQKSRGFGDRLRQSEKDVREQQQTMI